MKIANEPHFRTSALKRVTGVGRGGQAWGNSQGHDCRPVGWRSRGLPIHPDREGTAGDNAEGEDTFAEEKVTGRENLERKGHEYDITS